jgi:hypothetical protein
MAIPTVVGAGASDAWGVGPTGSPALPTGWAENDILLLFADMDAGDAITSILPTGWTEVAGSPQVVGTAGSITSTKLQVFWKRATASEIAPTVSFSGDHIVCRIVAFRGCETSGNPWNMTGGDVEATSDTSFSLAQGAGNRTTTVDECLVVVMATRTTDSSGTAQFGSWASTSLNNVVSANDFEMGTTVGHGGGGALQTGEMPVAGIFNMTCTYVTACPKAYLAVALMPPQGAPPAGRVFQLAGEGGALAGIAGGLAA